MNRGARAKGRLWIVFAALSALIVVPLYAVKVYEKEDYTDFSVYYRAAARAKAAQWSQAYTLSDGAAPFRYVPPVIPWLRPFGELELRAARVSWYFLQCFWIAIAVHALAQTARLAGGKRSRLSHWASASIGILFVLRFCLDCFTIGQVTTLMLAGYALALLAWTAGRARTSGAWLSIPAALKIGPGISYLQLALSPRGASGRRLSSRFAPFLAAAGVFAFANLLLLAWLGSFELFTLLWRGWFQIVANDANYFDAAHYGSQSLKSALLRLPLARETALATHAVLSVAGILALVLFWSLRRARSLRGRALIFATTIFPYLWFMPETFKYSLIPLALPVTMLVSGRDRLSRLSLVALVFGAGTLSLAGLDIVGDTLFFGMQRASVPFLATVLLGLATFREAWRASAPSELGRFVADLARPLGLGPWRKLPEAPSIDLSVIVPLPLSSLVMLDSGIVATTIASARRELDGMGITYEMIAVPYGNRASADHPVLQAIKSPELRVLWSENERARGVEDQRGAALREGFLEARGRRLASLQVEQPCDPEFLARAWRSVDSGALLVRANRRLEQSRFRVPVKLLPLVYGRHRMGLIFNRLVRLMLPALPSHSTDTQSGTWMIEGRLAAHAFATQAAPDFLFEIELGLACAALNGREVALPARLFVAEEKRKSRMLGESLEILRGLPRLRRRFRMGLYSPERANPRAITADDWGLSAGVNAGILHLARAGVVRRVSVMATLPHAAEGLAELSRIPGIEIGLHFNLTHGRFPSQQTLLRHSSPLMLLMRWIRAPRADRARVVQAELSRQLDGLAALGGLCVQASYIDGHQHMHLLPGMLQAIAPVLKSRGIQVVRIPYDPTLWLTPKGPILILALIGRRIARRLGFSSRAVFYPQPSHVRDPARLRARLRRDPEAEVITHPAAFNDLDDPSIEFRDAYTSERIAEFLSLQMLAERPEMDA